LVFVDEKGDAIPVMPADYGFRSGAGRLYQEGYGSVPTSAFKLAIANFQRELASLRRSVRIDELSAIALSPEKPGPLRRASAAASQSIRYQFLKLDQWLVDQGIFASMEDIGAGNNGSSSLISGVSPKDAFAPNLTEKERKILIKVKKLKLNDDLVAKREKERSVTGDDVDAPLAVRIPYASLCFILDIIYKDRPIQRFWFLETVARMPYFGFISLLHLYESLGWWRAAAELRRVHFAEEWNELHHLQIMEALGGDSLWIDRFLSQHAAVFYYWVLIGMYLISPSASYAFCELVENHATDTYTEFAEQNKEKLKAIPPPLVALNYYKGGDLYMLDAFQSSTGYGAGGPTPARRPPCNNLYDVFINIRDDEIEHSKTMRACQDGSIVLDLQNAAGMMSFAEEQGIRSLACSLDFDDDTDE
jgi:ubiquinol oxidase